MPTWLPRGPSIALVLTILIIAPDPAFALQNVRYVGEVKAGLDNAAAVAIAPTGEIYSLDARRKVVSIVNADRTPSGEFGGSGRDPGSFSRPVDIAVAPSGEVVVADAGQNRVHIFTGEGKFIAAFGGKGSQRGQFKKLAGVAVDRFGAIYTADSGNGRIWQFSDRGVLLRGIRFAEHMPADVSVDRQGTVYALLPGLSAIGKYTSIQPVKEQLIKPQGKNLLAQASSLFVDHRGDLLVSVPKKNRIYKYSPDGALLASFGSKGRGPGQFAQPLDIAGDRDDHIYVADSGNKRTQILRLESDGRPSLQPVMRSQPGASLIDVRNHGKGSKDLAWLGPSHTVVLSRTNSNVVLQQQETRVVGKPGRKAGQLRNPGGIGAQANGSFLVADSDNHRVQIFDTTGAPRYVFGERGREDGQFKSPADVAINSKGVVYVADTGNHRIQVFTDQGIFLTAFGGKSPKSGANAERATFTSPNSLVVDSRDRVLVLDMGNERIQVFDENGQFVQSTGPIRGASALAVDARDNFYVGARACQCVQVFDAAGQHLLSFGSGAEGPGRLAAISALAVLGDEIQVLNSESGYAKVFRLELDGILLEERESIIQSYFVPAFDAQAPADRRHFRDAAVAKALSALAERLGTVPSALAPGVRIDLDEQIAEGEYRLQISVPADVPESIEPKPAVVEKPRQEKGFELK